MSAHLSAHFTAAVITDVGMPWETAAELAYSAIRQALAHELDRADPCE
ncbi:hypothetical protein [Nocardia miyunensis]|nr:hypothetical protein [Nocardia miyunensis]